MLTPSQLFWSDVSVIADKRPLGNRNGLATALSLEGEGALHGTRHGVEGAYYDASTSRGCGPVREDTKAAVRDSARDTMK